MSSKTRLPWQWVGYVFVGGCLGTLSRAGLSTLWPVADGAFPWVTFAINLTGAFLLAFLLETLALAGPLDGRRKLIAVTSGTGFMGSFTTYSTFMLESEGLLTDGHLPLGALYLLGSIFLGLVAAGAGLLLAHSLFERVAEEAQEVRQ